MFMYVKGNLFESPARVLVNTVNTEGVMGKGIAKDFKTIYPEMFKRYQHLCETGQFTVGKLWLYKTPNKWVLNFPTKTTWRKPSRVEYIESGLQAFARGYAEKRITSIAFPLLGCGNGELNWEKQVKPLMENYLSKLPIDVFIYIPDFPQAVPEHRNIRETAAWLSAEPEALGFAEVWRDLREEIGDGITLPTWGGNETFTITLHAETNGISIATARQRHVITGEELTELWNSIRTFGFGMVHTVPPSLVSHTQYLFPLFARLPYCRQVQAGKTYHSLQSSLSSGIRIQPRRLVLPKQKSLTVVPA